MNLYFRLIATWLRCQWEARISTRQSCTQYFRVWPGDLDLFGHMNNGRYLQIMDVARMRWLWRTGTVAQIRRNNWRVALGGNITRFRRPLNLFQRYRVESRLLCWDQQWFFLEHVFFDDSDRLLSVGMSRAAFRGKGRWVATQDVMDNVDPGAASIELPEHIQTWMDAELMLGEFCDPATGVSSPKANRHVHEVVNNTATLRQSPAAPASDRASADPR